MRKSSKKLLLALLLIFVLVQTPLIMAANPTAQNPLVVKIGMSSSPTMMIGDKEVNTPVWAEMLAYQSAVEKYSQGRVKVELYPNGRLGDDKAMMEQVMNGNIFAIATGTGTLAPFYDRIQVLDVPYIFKDTTTVNKVVDGPVVQKLFNDMAAKTGFRIISCGAGGFVCYANKKKELRVPADIKGLKMRVPNTPTAIEMMKAVGAIPCPVAWMEVYTALQTGVVDGMQHTPSAILNMSFYEVQKYFTVSKHYAFIEIMAANEKFLKSLPADLQKVFKKAGKESSIAVNRRTAEVDVLVVEALKKKGMQVYEPTPAEMSLWKKKIQGPVAAWFKKNIDSKLMDELLKAAKKANK